MQFPLGDTDVKDLQYTVVKSRRKAIDLITDIYDAKAKTMIKSIKDIENGHINPGKSYKSLNVDDLRRSFKSNGSMVSDILHSKIRVIYPPLFAGGERLGSHCRYSGSLKNTTETNFVIGLLQL